MHVINRFRYIVGVIMFAALSHHNAFAKDLIELSPAQRIALGIESRPVSLWHGEDQGNLTGTVIAPLNNIITIASPFEGILLHSAIVPGMTVKAGQPVVTLHSLDYLQSSQDLAGLRAEAAHLDKVVQNIEALKDIGLRSARELAKAERDHAAAQRAVTRLQARFRAIKAGPDADEFVLKAPETGIVTHMLAKAGDPIEAHMPISTLMAGEQFWARLAVPERLIGSVQSTAGLSLQSTGDMADIVAIDPEVDPQTRSVDVLVSLPSGHFRIGQLLTFDLMSEGNSTDLSIPAAAIVRIEGQDTIFVDTHDGIEPRNISVLERAARSFRVSNGLNSGDHVVTSGLAALKNIVESQD